jgi:Ca2+/Na+ antiporter
MIAASDMDNPKSITLGLGTIISSGCYGMIILILDFTLCLAIASLFTINDGLYINRKLFYRETCIYFVTIILLIFFLRDNVIELWEALFIICMCPIGIIYSLSSEKKSIEM